MGIEGLWKIVEPARRPRRLMELMVTEGWAPGANADGFLRVSIDISIWISQADSVFGIQGRHYQAGENPELNNFFQRLVRLRGLPGVFVFVFEGADRPLEKHSSRASRTPHALAASMREMIEVFGYYSVQAPGEAEAELAKLSAHGRLDAIITDDSDALVFGAKHIICSSSLEKNSDKVYVYNASCIETHPEVQLSRNGLILFAILRGGDYSVGLPQCGERISYGIACSKDLADALVDLANPIYSPEVAEHRRCQWRDSLVHHLRTDPEGRLGRSHEAVIASLGDHPSFPSLNILGLYLDPVTSAASEPAFTAEWSARTADIPTIIRLCERSFSWGTLEQLGECFLGAKNLWPALVRSALLLPPNVGAVLHGEIVAVDTPTATGPHKYGKIIRIISHGHNAQFGFQGYRVEVDAQEFRDAISRNCLELRKDSTDTTKAAGKQRQKPKKVRAGNEVENRGRPLQSTMEGGPNRCLNLASQKT
ncbi:PIN domain-like protein [Coprinopsis sp. MPI-PUGE-AT-0042]|nr:PIN domain-like protein [Coprinopsis sp. MPI-PUGE-AT-0042]